MNARATTVKKSLELIVEADPEGHVAATVPVRWIISEEMSKKLATKTSELDVLLVVTNGKTEMSRHVIPLKNGMTYIPLRRPGINTVHGTVVWQRDGYPTVKSVLFSKDPDGWGNYQIELVSYSNREIERLDRRIREIEEHLYGFSRPRIYGWNRKRLQKRLSRLFMWRSRLQSDLKETLQIKMNISSVNSMGVDAVNIEVPNEMFAPVPPRWMNWLGNLYKWPRPARDQCSLRRRALITVFSLPLAAVAAVVMGAILAIVYLFAKLFMLLATAVLLLFGMRGINYEVLWRYDEWVPADLWESLMPSFWWFKAVDKDSWRTKYKRRNPAFLVINPPMLLAVFMTTWNFTPTDPKRAALIAIVGVLVVGSSIALLSLRAKKKVETPAMSVEGRSKLQRQLALVTAGEASRTARVSELPREQRTFELRYLALKAAVCKPFAN